MGLNPITCDGALLMLKGIQLSNNTTLLNLNFLVLYIFIVTNNTPSHYTYEIITYTCLFEYVLPPISIKHKTTVGSIVPLQLSLLYTYTIYISIYTLYCRNIALYHFYHFTKMIKCSCYLKWSHIKRFIKYRSSAAS